MSGIIAQNSGRHTGLVKASSGGGGVWNLIETLTASSDATLDFTSGIDSTYDEYVFKIINLHPSDDRSLFSFQGNAAGGSGYNETMTTTMFRAYHNEDGDDQALGYVSSGDQEQGTAFQPITTHVGNDNDENAVGNLWLYNPSDTTYVKHFISQCSANQGQYDYLITNYVAGYFNTTSAIDEIQFKFDAGTIDAGTISLYGIS
jgi:hypothetical protein